MSCDTEENRKLSGEFWESPFTQELSFVFQQVCLMCEPASQASHASQGASHASNASQGASHASHGFNVKKKY